MNFYLSKIQVFVDNIVKQSNCKSVNDVLRLNHYIWLAIISIPLGVPFILKNILSQNYNTALIVSLVMISMLGSISFISKIKNVSIIYHTNNLTFMLMLISVSMLGDKIEGQILWCYIYPMLSIFLFGNRIGIWWSIFLLISVYVGLVVSEKVDLTHSIDFKIRFFVIYLTILCISSWSEYYRSRYVKESIRQKEQLENERESLNKEISRRIQLEAELQKLANFDGLTDMYNRRYFLSRAREELTRAHRYSIPVSLAVIDMDKFKAINDLYGHPAGDEVLESFAKHCKNYIRKTDLAGRIGGEEFAILLTHTSVKDAYNLMDRFRKEVSELLFVFNGQKQQVTISIGLATIDKLNSDIDYLYSKADEALFKAKRNGRNKIEVEN